MELLNFPLSEVLVVSILTETFVNAIKTMVPFEFKSQGKEMLAAIISIVLCLLLQVGIFPHGSLVVYYLGCVLAGVISSRGSNFIHDFMSKINAIKSTK